MDINNPFEDTDSIKPPSRYLYLLSLPSSVWVGLFVYAILSSMFTPLRITIPVSIIMSVLIFGLTNYYSNKTNQSNSTVNKIAWDTSSLNIVFVEAYVGLLIVSFLLPNHNSELFLPWQQFTAPQIIRLVSAIALSFFMPGYA